MVRNTINNADNNHVLWHLSEFKKQWVRSNTTDKKKQWWMEIVVPSNVCIEPTEEIAKVGTNDVYPHVLIRITWDNIIKYGQYAVHKVKEYGTYNPNAIRLQLHDLRKSIAKALQTLCKGECVWETVGSESTVSDIDVNVFDDRIDELKPVLDKNVSSWLNGNRLDVLFDMNIYLSAFGRKETTSRRKRENIKHLRKIPLTDKESYVYVQPLGSPSYVQSQLTWGLLHLYEESLHTLFERTLDGYISTSQLSDSWEKAKELYDVLQKGKQNPDKTIFGLVRESQNLWNEISTIRLTDDDTGQESELLEKYMNRISMIQYFSRETYNTRGAYFHVVMQLGNKDTILNLDIQPFEYRDSVIDNLAFIAELCQKETLCPVQYTSIFAKISKYIYRICDALIRLGLDKTGVVVSVLKRADVLNKARKATDVSPETISVYIKDLHEILGVSFTDTEEFTNFDLSYLFETIMTFVLNELLDKKQTVSIRNPSKCVGRTCSTLSALRNHSRSRYTNTRKNASKA